MLGSIPYGPGFHLGTAAWNGDHDPQVRSEERGSLAVYHLDESPYHMFGGLEVCDNAVFHRPDSLDIRIRSLVHQPGLCSNGHRLFRVHVYRDDRRLIDHDLVFHENDGVGRSEVDCKFLG